MSKRKRRRAKGTGSVYRRAGAQVWTVAWTQNGVQHTESGFPDEETAERFRCLKVVDVAEGKDPRLKKKHTGTLRDLAEVWLTTRCGTKAEGDKPPMAGTHRSGNQDRYRWEGHLREAVGHLAPDDLDAATLRTVLEERLAAGLSPATVQLLQRLVSTLYTDLIEQGVASRNPARMLPRKFRKRIKPTYDPKKTPFVEKREDVAKLFQALPEPINVAYALSALAGLRPGEARALKWTNVDLNRRMIYVRESTKGPTKDKDSREAPIVPALHDLLVTWRQKNPNDLVCAPMRRSVRPRFLGEKTINARISKACEKSGIPVLTYYEAGRHTFASHWVLAGGSIEKLRTILGH